MVTRSSRLALLALTVLAAGVCSALGVWQARRLASRRAANRIAVAGRELPPVDLGNLTSPGSLDQRRALATGTFDHDHAIVLRARSERDVPGVHIVTPLRLDGRMEAVLVNRGFVPANDAMHPDSALVDRTVHLTVHGLAFRIPENPDSGTPLIREGRTTWRRLDLPTLRARLPYPILDIYLYETGPEPRAKGAPLFPRPTPIPEPDDGPHLYYMVQWFGLAAASLAFGVLFVWRGTGRRIEE
jgi:surfeit locus 1 family protein